MFLKKNLKKFPLHEILKNFIAKKIDTNILLHTKFIFITFHIHQIHFSCGPQGGGPVAFSTAIITWCKLYASYYLFGAESLFNLAVLDCVKPDIDQVASVVYCMIEWKLKRRQIKLFEVTTQNAGRQTSIQNFQLRNPDGTAQLQQAQQFKGNTSAATSGLHCNLMLHTTVQSVFVTPFTIWLQQGNHQR